MLQLGLVGLVRQLLLKEVNFDLELLVAHWLGSSIIVLAATHETGLQVLQP